jgi:toxin-antitoxin system PIN domain toxin
MVLPDVNVLVHAHREDTPQHTACLDWLETMVNGDASYGLADLVLSGFVRVVTHPKVFTRPSSLADAIAFIEQLRGRQNCVPVAPGPRHWNIFCSLCVGADAKGNLVPDAYLAAMAIESGCEWITTDRDFSRFEGLLWRHPLK